MSQRPEPYLLVPRLDTRRVGVDPASFAVSRRELLALLRSPTGHTAAEYLCPRNTACRPYFDSERYFRDAAEAAAHLGAYGARVRAAMERAVSVLAPYATGQAGVSFDLAQRHGEVAAKGGDTRRYKLSFRAFVSGVRVARHSHIPAFARELFDGADLDDLWDLAVYKDADQCVSAVLGFKTADDRRALIPLDPAFDARDDEALLRFVVQHYDPAWPELAVPSPSPATFPNPSPAAFVGGSATADDDVAALVRMLGDATATAYESWRNVAIVLKSEGASGGADDRYLGLFHEFSRRSTGKYGGPEPVDRLWRSLRIRSPEDAAAAAAEGKPLLTVGTLRRYARLDSPAEYARWSSDAAAAAATTRTAARQEEDGGQLQVMMLDGARRLLDAMSFADELDDLEPLASDSATAEHQQASFAATHRATGRRCVVSLGLRDLRASVTLDDGAVVYDRHLNRDVGLEVTRDLCRVHKDIPPDQTWTVTRPSARKAVFQAGAFAGRHAEVNLCNLDRPSDEMVARVSLPDAKPHHVTHKGHLAFMVEAYNESVSRAIAGMNLGWAVSVVGNNNRVVLNCAAEGSRSDDDLSSAWLSVFQDADPNERGMFKIAKDGSDFFLFDERSGTWHVRSAMESSNRMLRAMKTIAGGRFWASLTDAERRYVGSDRGGKAVFNRSVNALWTDDFRERLDSVLAIVPFRNGALELATGAFRPLRWDDYVTQTIGYDFAAAEDVPDEHHAFVKRFFEQVLPFPDERELVLRMLGSTLDGKLVNKRFLVLQDHRGGDNGKSMVVKAAEFALGAFCMPNQPAFLYSSAHVNPNGHEANTLAYKGKRLAVFDETDPKARFDLAKLKSITGGAPRMAVRGAGASSLTQFRWSAFVLIACNKGCLPQIDASDAAFLNRMIPVPMRAKFRAPRGSAARDAGDAEGARDRDEDEPHSFPMDVNIQEKLSNARMAVMHALLGAHRRYVEAGEGFGALPASCAELRSAIANESDPRLEAIDRFIRTNVGTERLPGQRGRRLLGYIRRDDLVRRIRDSSAIFRDVKVTAMKDLVERAMAAHSVVMSAKTTVDGDNVYNVFKGCEWRAHFEDDKS